MKNLLLVLQFFAEWSGALKKVWIALSSWYFDRSGAAIYAVPPVARGDDDLAVVTLLQKEDVVKYLHAIKSFALYALKPTEVHVINDGSLSGDDKEKLESQIDGLHIHDMALIAVEGCPTGGCWERLKYVVDLSQRIYTVQLDADTLSMGPLPEVVDAVKNNRSFLLGTHSGETIVTTEQAADFAEKRDLSHVQIHAEQQMKNLTIPQNKYLRASAGFAGFARGVAHWDMVLAFSAEMEKLVTHPDWSWSSWGTEQVTSNFVLANTLAPVVLIEPDYVNHTAKETDLGARFFHFIGTHRFTDDTYRRLAGEFARRYADQL